MYKKKKKSPESFLIVYPFASLAISHVFFFHPNVEESSPKFKFVSPSSYFLLLKSSSFITEKQDAYRFLLLRVDYHGRGFEKKERVEGSNFNSWKLFLYWERQSFFFRGKAATCMTFATKNISCFDKLCDRSALNDSRLIFVSGAEASWEEWWTYDGISGECDFSFRNFIIISSSYRNQISSFYFPLQILPDRKRVQIVLKCCQYLAN